MNSSVLSGAASASYRARASLSNTPVSAVAWITRAGWVIRARCGAAVPELRRAGGSVVLTVSTSGFYPGRGGVLYVASKFAVRGCVIALAHELAPDVRVNGVAPGGTLGTELTGPASLGLDGRVLGAAVGREQDLRRRTPLHVALSGEDHAGSYVFLASDRARGITGTVVHSDGGIGIR